MLHAVTFDDILMRAPAWGKPLEPFGQRLISIVFARPSSPVWRDLETNRAFLDLRSGDAWDLFFAGMSAFAAQEADAIPIADPNWHGGYTRYLNPRAFREIEETIYRGQRRIAEKADHEFEVWRYSGETDLVSFMCYAREPDWLSLRSVRIEESPAGRSISLGQITEGLTRWSSGDVDERLAPGRAAKRVDRAHATSLDKALSWAALTVTGGVLGNSAYDLIKALTGH
jgi:hypothetical protein